MLRLSLLGYWIVCFVATHLSPSEIPDVSMPYLDKIVHLSMYLFLSVLFSLNFPKVRWHGLWVLLAYAVIDELTQPLFGRTAEFSDGFCDLVGIVLGIFLAARWTKFRTIRY